MKRGFRLMVAPMQGLTEAAWRRAHFEMFGEQQGEVEYFTPFIRVEKGEARARDLRDLISDLNREMMLTPQIIFSDEDEWRILVDTIAGAGATNIDMNLGCPFVLQVRKGRGAGMLRQREQLVNIAEAMIAYAGSVNFSVKMRLGVDDPGEALGLVDILNAMPLRHVTVHPRTAAQQYKGRVLLDEMSGFASRLKHPMIFNGEISSPSDIEALSSYAGVMVGRGLLSRPSLFAEFRSGRELTTREQEESFMNLVRHVYSEYGQRLCGAAQLRDKMKPYWDYAPPTLDKKTVKQGKKTGMPLDR